MRQHTGNWDALIGIGTYTHLSFQDPADLGKVCPDLIGDIIEYQVSFQTGTFVNSESVNIVSCAAGRCSHSFDATYNLLNGSLSVSIDNVSVVAENVVGVGAARKCTAQPISEFLSRDI